MSDEAKRQSEERIRKASNGKVGRDDLLAAGVRLGLSDFLGKLDYVTDKLMRLEDGAALMKRADIGCEMVMDEDGSALVAVDDLQMVFRKREGQPLEVVTPPSE